MRVPFLSVDCPRSSAAFGLLFEPIGSISFDSTCDILSTEMKGLTCGVGTER